jgi:hypothetical protein
MCFKFNCDFNQDFGFDVLVLLDGGGKVVKVTLETYGEPGSSAVIAQIEECHEELLAGEIFPCLAGEEVWIYPSLAGIIQE